MEWDVGINKHRLFGCLVRGVSSVSMSFLFIFVVLLDNWFCKG